MCDPSMRRPLYASASALISATAVLSVTASLHEYFVKMVTEAYLHENFLSQVLIASNDTP